MGTKIDRTEGPGESYEEGGKGLFARKLLAVKSVINVLRATLMVENGLNYIASISWKGKSGQGSTVLLAEQSLQHSRRREWRARLQSDSIIASSRQYISI